MNGREPSIISTPPGATFSVARFALVVGLPALILLLGTIGYATIEHWSVFDAFYMTVMTLSTNGGSPHPLDDAGRAFTTALALGGTLTFFYVVAELLRAIIGGEIREFFGRQRMERSLSAISDHVVVCGHGRMGRRICEELAHGKTGFVLVEHREEAFSEVDRDWLVVRGDATHESVLKRAGIRRARAVVSVLPSDSDNLFITMTARLLKEDLFIVARAETEESETKLKRAGADRVVAPYVLGSHRVAQALLRPSVLEFIDLATRTSHLELQMEETAIARKSRLAGKKLEETPLTDGRRILLVALRRPSGQMVFNPPAETSVGEGDTLITLGSRDEHDRLRELAGQTD